MPMYEYECKRCGNTFELLRSMNQDDSGVVCQKCGAAQVRRKFSVIAAVSRSGDNGVSDFAEGGTCSSSGICGCSGLSCSH